jgi:hypothetical protein
VAIVVIVSVASALTSGGSPTPQAGQGNSARGAGGTAGSPSSAPPSRNPTIIGSTYVDQLPSNVIESHVVDVNLVKIVDPAQETNVGDVVAGNGYRLIALVFQVKCISGHEYAETNVQITTSDGQDYSPVIAGIVGYSNFAGDQQAYVISAGDTDTFVIPYLLPDNVTITGVEWEPYFSGQPVGKWEVRE